MRNLLFLLTLLISSSFVTAQEFIQTYPDAGARSMKITKPSNFFNILTQNDETNAWNALNISESTGDVISINQAADNSLQRHLAHSFFYELDTIQNSTDKDIQYSKYQPNGTLVWQRTLDLDLDNFGLCVIPTNDDNLLLGGVTQVGSDTLQRIFLTKMTQDGDVLWHRILPKSATKYDSILGYIIGLDGETYTLKEVGLNKIYPTKDGGYLIRNNHGYNGGGVLGAYNNWIKTDAYGRVLWSNSILIGSKNINNPVPSTGYTQYANGMVDSWEDGSVVIGFDTKIGTSQSSSAPIIKFNSVGETVFSKYYNGHSWTNDNHGIMARPNGGVFHVLYHGDLASSAIGMTRNAVTVFGYSPNADDSDYLPDANYILDFPENGFINSNTQEFTSVDEFAIHDFYVVDDNKFLIAGAINDENTNFYDYSSYEEGTGGTPFAALYDLTQECNTYEKDFAFFGEYEGHTYFLSEVAYPLEEMEGVAASIGGYLASINSKGENDFLNDEALGSTAIIGLSDTTTEGEFAWANGEPVDFTNFSDCLPDCENTEDLDYVQMDFGNGIWSFANNTTGTYRFVIEVDCAGPTELLPDLTIESTTPLPSATAAGNIVPFELEISNYGSADQSGTFNVNAYLSLDGSLSTDDYAVGTVEMSDIVMTTTQNIEFSINIPTDIMANFYHLIFAVDADETIVETTEENNFHIASDFATYNPNNTIEVLSTGIDIRFNFLNVASGTMVQGEDYLYPVSISNYGSEDLTQPIKIGIYNKYGFPYLSTGEQILAADQWGEFILTELPAGVTDTIQIPVPVPADAVYGSYPRLYFYADYDNQLEEIREDNNFLSTYTSLNLTGDSYIEFAIENIQGFPNTLAQGETFDLSFDVVNTGTLPADGEFTVNLSLANDSWSSAFFGYDKNFTLSNLAPGGVQNISTTLTVAPHSYTLNNYRVRFIIDTENTITEASEQNNTIMSSQSATITESPNPDLSLSNLTEIADTLTQGDVVFFYFDVENLGEEVAAGEYNIKMYLQPYSYFNLEYESTYLEVGIIQTGFTPPGVIPGVYAGITIPEGFPTGDYYINIVMDANDDIEEKNESNNYISEPVYIKSITDDFAWELECPEDIVVQIGNETEVIVDWDIADISTANNCSEDLTIDVFGQSLGFCPGGLFPVGVDTIEYGIAGFCFDTYAEASCQFTVTVVSHPIITVEETVTLCAGETYDGTEYFENDIISETVVYPDFDSVFVTNIIVLETFETTVNQSSCNPDDVGTFTQLLIAQNGCDSLVTTEIIFSESAESNLIEELCTGESIMVNGTIYDADNTTGTETFPMGSVNGCDSLVNVDLTFIEVTEGQFTTAFCPGESILINGTIYDFDNQTGQEVFPNGSQSGCDSILNVALFFGENTAGNFSTSLCPGESIEINGTIYNENNQTGTEILDVQNQYGCDSTLNVTIELLEEYNLDVGISLTEGGTYNDQVILNDTLIIENYTSIDGCDSIVNVMIDIMTAVGNENQLENESALTLFPNPAKNNEVNVILETALQGGWHIQVMNTLGQLISSQKININTGTHSLKIKDLASGTYFVSAEREGSRLVRKLVVL